MRALRRSLGAPLLAALLLGVAPGAATACAIDNVASLLADGVPAMLTTSAPPGTVPWAPFTVAQAIASGATVRLAEEPGDLARTLPPAVRAIPYRWAFGDGGTRRGYAVVHRYRRAGTYRLTVSGYDRGARRWFAFDQAVLRVVPADQVVGANLEYDALQGAIALSGHFLQVKDFWSLSRAFSPLLSGNFCLRAVMARQLRGAASTPGTSGPPRMRCTGSSTPSGPPWMAKIRVLDI